jgi:nucleoside-diphosphate-sugar epimerase
MKIALTGASSAIGVYLLERFEALGHEVIKFTRRPADINDRYFDIENPENLTHDCDILIHLGWRYWDIGDPTDQNLVATIKLLDSFPQKSQVIFLSSLSAYNTKSRYGQEKLQIEELFLARHGLAIRAGVLWGGNAFSGIVSTIGRIAKIPILCLHLNPDPILFLTHYEDIFEEISEYLKVQKGGLAISGNPQSVSFVEILHTINQKNFMHLSLHIKLVVVLARILNAIKLKIPFRVDSLHGVLNNCAAEISTAINSKVESSNTIEEFKNWLIRDTEKECH